MYVTKEPVQKADTFKYVIITSVMILVLIVAIILLCVFRSCMKKKNEEEILKIQQVMQKDDSNFMGHNNGNMPESINAAVPLEELTQYTMKTGKNADIDLIRSTTASRNKGADMDNLKVTRTNQVSDVSS